MERMKRIQEKAKAVLKKTQEEIKWYVDKRRKEKEKYQKENLVILSTKDLK